MGITSENVASQFGVSRADQDAFAAESQQKASRAQKAGKFVSEIVPVTVTFEDEQSGQVKTIRVEQDDGIREGVTAESLGKLKPAFSKTGTTHAGNASQITDGAAAVLLARRSTANKLGLKIIGKFVTAAVVGGRHQSFLYHFDDSEPTSPRSPSICDGYRTCICNSKSTRISWSHRQRH